MTIGKPLNIADRSDIPGVPDANAIAICYCGCTTFRLAVKIERLHTGQDANLLRGIECVQCRKVLATPHLFGVPTIS